MLTKDGPKVLEFNCRLGDPETQVILPRLKSDLAEILYATASGELQDLRVEWDDRACVAVVAASGGYPSSYTTGYPISGIKDAGHEAIAFHAGTKLDGDTVVTDGGRVLTISAIADTIADARALAYQNISRITFKDAFYRTDIAALDNHSS